jgi:hypothetical protein
MAPGWGASGRRILLPIAVRFADNGVVEPLAVGRGLHLSTSQLKT